MRDARHIGNNQRDHDKRFDFISPNAPAGREGRTAMHRYLPAEMREEGARPKAAGAAVEEPCSSSDFKPRWWPAPDSWR